jgi:hypothetical protein
MMIRAALGEECLYTQTSHVEGLLKYFAPQLLGAPFEDCMVLLSNLHEQAIDEEELFQHIESVLKRETALTLLDCCPFGKVPVHAFREAVRICKAGRIEALFQRAMINSIVY